MKQYDVIYADPPWSYNQGLKERNRADNHYRCLPFDEILALPVKNLAKPNCLLFMWATSAFLQAAIQVGNQWGFQYRSMAFVWEKLGRGNPGPWTFQTTEFVLLFAKGSRPKPKGATNVHQLVRAPKLAHSQKPEEVRTRIELIAGEDKAMIELFARKHTVGWDAHGDEITNGILL